MLQLQARRRDRSQPDDMASQDNFHARFSARTRVRPCRRASNHQLLIVFVLFSLPFHYSTYAIFCQLLHE